MQEDAALHAYNLANWRVKILDAQIRRQKRVKVLMGDADSVNEAKFTKPASPKQTAAADAIKPNVQAIDSIGAAPAPAPAAAKADVKAAAAPAVDASDKKSGDAGKKKAVGNAAVIQLRGKDESSRDDDRDHNMDKSEDDSRNSDEDTKNNDSSKGDDDSSRNDDSSKGDDDSSKGDDSSKRDDQDNAQDEDVKDDDNMRVPDQSEDEKADEAA
jgi:hypothetical protein